MDLQNHLKNKKYRSIVTNKNGYYKVYFSGANRNHSYMFCDVIFESLDKL